MVFTLLQPHLNQELTSCMDIGMSQELEHCSSQALVLMLQCLVCDKFDITGNSDSRRKQKSVMKPHLFPSGLFGSSEMQGNSFGWSEITTIPFASQGI